MEKITLKGEAMIDSFIDISNYGIIAQLVMKVSGNDKINHIRFRWSFS
jgi:hypothetical protein